MIQRIQTIYLLVAGALAGIYAFTPLLYFSTADGLVYNIYARGVEVSGMRLEGVVYLWILAGAAAILPLLNILLFKWRMLQIRLCIVNAVLLLGNYLLLGTYYYMVLSAFEEMGVAVRGFHPAVFSSLLALILVLFAGRAIFKDEVLVRSVDRIR